MRRDPGKLIRNEPVRWLPPPDDGEHLAVDEFCGTPKEDSDGE